MTDDQQNTATDPGAAKRSPLDALEDLLKDAQKNKGAVGAAPSLAALGGATPDAVGFEKGSEEEETDSRSSEEQLAEVAKLEEQKKQEDQVRIAEGLKDLQYEATQSPQAQARISQDQEKKVKDEQKASEREEYKIRQIEHTKIQE
ncbi:MAG: hypothetical protein PVJ09_00570 [Candidatus Woesebacteria bacterium]|jgi:hypothetical protein